MLSRERSKENKDIANHWWENVGIYLPQGSKILDIGSGPMAVVRDLMRISRRKSLHNTPLKFYCFDESNYLLSNGNRKNRKKQFLNNLLPLQSRVDPKNEVSIQIRNTISTLSAIGKTNSSLRRTLLEQLDEVSTRTANLLPVASNTFDAVQGMRTFLYVDNLEGAISEMVRVLKPGGRIYFQESDFSSVDVEKNSCPPEIYTLYQKMRNAIFANNFAHENVGSSLKPILEKLKMIAIKVETETFQPTDTWDKIQELRVEIFKDEVLERLQKEGVITDTEKSTWKECIKHIKKDSTWDGNQSHKFTMFREVKYKVVAEKPDVAYCI